MYRRVLSLWKALQVSRSGAYSRTKYEAFLEYQRSTSIQRAIVVCALTPLPSLAYVLLIEWGLPLAPVENGWRGNYNLWARVAIQSFTVSYGIVRMMNQFVSDERFKTPRLRTAVSSFFVTVLHLLVMIGYSAAWVFPVPFLLVQTELIHVALIPVMARFFIFDAHIHRTPEFLTALQYYGGSIACLGGMYHWYPVCSAIFASAQGISQPLVVLLPASTKCIMKAIIAGQTKKLGTEDHIPEATNFTVELFHAMYITICMQTASSPVRVIVFSMLLDYIPIIYSMIRMVSSRQAHAASSHAIIPHDATKGPSIIPTPEFERRRLLFESEYHAVVEYIECVIPCVYAAYIAVLFHLPNAAYYPHMRHVRSMQHVQTLLTNVGLLAILDFVSLIVFQLTLRRKCAVSCLHQLAFLLETQFEMVQLKLIVWVSVCLFVTLQHTGADFTLQFEWLRNQP